MPSPFPGMNPYLEQKNHWPDFHKTYLAALKTWLVPQVRPAFYVKMNDTLYENEPIADSCVIIESGDGAARSSEGEIEAPYQAVIPFEADVIHESHLEIRNRENHSLVSVIELLSPLKKESGSDREQFLGKRRHLLASSAHYLELDFLRGFARLPLEPLAECDYYVMVSRAERRPEVGVWPVRLRDPLPLIPIPLRVPHAEARLDLQAILHYVYDTSGYADYIYRGAPDPALIPDDDAWAKDLIARSSP